MTNSDENVKRNLEILRILDEAIELGPWDESLFLRATGDKLRKLRDQFRSTANFTSLEAHATEESTLDESEDRANQNLVFISLYNSAGSEIRNWEKLLSNLKATLITRPVWKNENYAKELIRSKTNKKNEAYIAVYVDQSSILPPIGGIIPKDVLGHDLMILREGAVKPDNIIRFVHVSGEYRFSQGRLKRLNL